jgi:tripartite ATP-independent transporter DctM subunit
MLVVGFIRVPIAFAMAGVGFIGIGLMRGWPAAMSSVSSTIYETGFQYTMIVVPLFILMGNFVTRAGLSHELYRAAYAFIGHRRGGLAMATVLACAGFGSICGSAVATAATMAKVAHPSMRSFGYSDGLATGSIAAGGTLGILIPPSVVMIIYCLMTEQHIGAMFAAGLLPGLVATLFYLGAVKYTVWRDPKSGPPGARVAWADRLAALRGIWGVLLLFSVVMGGLYGGFFTATEAAGIGAVGGLAFACWRGGLTFSTLSVIVAESVRTTAMLFVILIGALIFAAFINYTSMPQELRNLVTHFQIHPIAVVIAICFIYVLLGTAMEELSMILLTIPIFFPLIVDLGLNPIWFGILVVCVVEIGMISPPVGMNVFVLRSVLPQVPTRTVWAGVMPFFYADILRLAVLIAFPSIALILPRLLYG